MLFLIFFNKGKAPEIRLKVTVLTKSLETHVDHVIFNYTWNIDVTTVVATGNKALTNT